MESGYASVHVCVCVHAPVCACVRLCVCVCVCVYAHACLLPSAEPFLHNSQREWPYEGTRKMVEEGTFLLQKRIQR